MLEKEEVTALVINKSCFVDAYFAKSFTRLRQEDGITNENIIESLTPEANRKQVFKAGEASGASGSFFFFSHDKKFVIKTMTDKEMKFFNKRIALRYFKHFQDNPNSCLSRIYGVFTVKMQGHGAIHLMLLSHTLRFERSENVQRIFDLKGSTVNREVKMTNKMSRSKTLKDVNFIKLRRNEPLNMFEIDKLFILRQVAKDTEFLKSLNIMDYSLLLAVETKPNEI